jgi:hypothetical protein
LEKFMSIVNVVDVTVTLGDYGRINTDAALNAVDAALDIVLRSCGYCPIALTTGCRYSPDLLLIDYVVTIAGCDHIDLRHRACYVPVNNLAGKPGGLTSLAVLEKLREATKFALYFLSAGSTIVIDPFCDISFE